MQKRLNRKIGDKEYSKWQVVIPPDTIEKLGWKEGEDLVEEVNANTLHLKPRTARAKRHIETKDNIELARFAMKQKAKRSKEHDVI